MTLGSRRRRRPVPPVLRMQAGSPDNLVGCLGTLLFWVVFVGACVYYDQKHPRPPAPPTAYPSATSDGYIPFIPGAM